MYYPVNLPSAKTQLVHKDFHFQLGVRGNGQVSVVEQPQHDQKSLKKDFSTVTRHTAESRRPHRKKKIRVLAKKKKQSGGKTPRGTIITQFPGSFSWTRADGLCLELVGEAQ
jgi:flagella basal body P-ring formation protein FlgA